MRNLIKIKSSNKTAIFYKNIKAMLIKNNIMRLLILIILPLYVISCTEDLNVDYDGKTSNKLAVYGKITTDTTAHKVVLSRTVSNAADSPLPETNATVSISDGVNEYMLQEYEPGIYLTDSNVYGVPGNLYELNITTSDQKNYHATSFLNTVSEIDSIIVRKELFTFHDEYFYKVYFYGQEPKGVGQCYMWNIYLNDSLITDTINETRFEEDEWVDGAYLKDFDVFWLQEDVMNDDSIADFTLEMLSIPKNYYDYLVEIMLETTWRGSPWDPIPANVSTNISGGAVGFFAAMSKTQKSRKYLINDIEVIDE